MTKIEALKIVYELGLQNSINERDCDSDALREAFEQQEEAFEIVNKIIEKNKI